MDYVLAFLLGAAITILYRIALLLHGIDETLYELLQKQLEGRD